MAQTVITDIVKPEVYLAYREEKFPELNAFVKSGIYTSPPPEVMSQ